MGGSKGLLISKGVPTVANVVACAIIDDLVEVPIERKSKVRGGDVTGKETIGKD